MKRKKVETEILSHLVSAATARMEETTKRQMHSLLTLLMTTIILMTPYTASAEPSFEYNYNVFKNATVNGILGGNVTKAGDNVTFQILVNNTAGAPLTNLIINDTMLGLNVSVANLGAGNSWNYTGYYNVTQADLDNNGNGTGFIINNVTVVCDQNSTANNATARVPIANCTIVKTVESINGNSTIGNVTAAGDIIRYQIKVDNKGQVNLTNVNVSDPKIGLLNVTNLGIGSNETLYGNYTVTQADLNNNGNGTGFIINNATVISDQLGLKNATVSTPIANCTIVKTVESINGNSTIGNVTAAGDKIVYKIKVDNKGQVNLTNLTVNDTKIGLLNVTNLGIGSNETLYGNYTVTQADLNNNGNGTGFIINNATVRSDQLGLKNATVATPIQQNANCTIVKTVVGVDGVPGGNVTAAGDIVAYRVNVTNTGNVDLYNVTVTDPLIKNLAGPTSSINNDTILNVGEIWTYTGNYTATQADINNNGTAGNGFINNNATVVGNYTVTQIDTNNNNTVISHSQPLSPRNSIARVHVERHPAYNIFKSVISPDDTGDCIVNSPGDDIPYRIVVQNEGNVDLTNVTVNDTLFTLPAPSGDDNSDEVLNPGETWIYEETYYLKQADVDNGNVTNNATVVCDQLPEKSSKVNTPVDQNADLSIYKSVIGIDEDGDHMINQAGDVINYQVAVKNNGDVALTGVSVEDPMITLAKTSGDHYEPGVLNPGETWIYTGDYTVTQQDIDSAGNGIGFIANTASVSCNELDTETSSIELPIIRLINEPVKVLPVADFSASVTSGYAPLSVQFTDKSQNAAAWSWDFNSDGTVDSTVQSPTYVYNNEGTYVAKLTVTNTNGSNSKPETINVLKKVSSSSGGSSGGRSGGTGGATVVSTSSTVSTPATANVTETETSAPVVEPTTTPATVQAPEPNNTTTPKQSKRTPGFELVGGIIGLLGAVYLYRKR